MWFGYLNEQVPEMKELIIIYDVLRTMMKMYQNEAEFIRSGTIYITLKERCPPGSIPAGVAPLCYDGGMVLAVCPLPSAGLLPNQDIFHSNVSLISSCSSLLKRNRVDMAFTRWMAWQEKGWDSGIIMMT
jgi:hypothetical protein